MGINSYNTVGVYNLNVSLKALANSSQYGELEIEISSVIPYYTYGSSDPFGGISFDFEYEVIGGKGKKKVPKDLLSGDINGVFTFADSSRYLSSLKNLVESELEYAFNLGYGNDFNTVCSYIFGETITDVISKTNYKSYSHIVWESLTAPSKRIEIKCPVDIYVYDEDDNLCATIIDNEIEIDNEDIKIEINGDEKYITVYDGEYRFEYIATATGNMTITIDEFSNMSNKIRTVEFNDIELTTGEIYETTISDLYLNDDYQVVVSDKDVITSDYDSVLVHQPQIVEIVDSDPTCVDEGSKHYECSVCKEVVSSELIPKISHIEEIVPSVDSTCTVSGYTESIRCSSCKTILVEAKVIPATGHTSDNGTITTPATCTKEGVKTYKCTVCSETLKTESIAKTDHKSDSGKVTKSPTCTAEGVKTYSCTVCSTVIKTEKVAMTSHTDSNNDNVCDECGTSLGTEENPSKNCSCNCHKSGFLGFIYKIQRFFWKLFKTHKTCGCGVTHY